MSPELDDEEDKSADLSILFFLISASRSARAQRAQAAERRLGLASTSSTSSTSSTPLRLGASISLSHSHSHDDDGEDDEEEEVEEDEDIPETDTERRERLNLDADSNDGGGGEQESIQSCLDHWLSQDRLPASSSPDPSSSSGPGGKLVHPPGHSSKPGLGKGKAAGSAGSGLVQQEVDRRTNEGSSLGRLGRSTLIMSTSRVGSSAESTSSSIHPIATRKPPANLDPESDAEVEDWACEACTLCVVFSLPICYVEFEGADACISPRLTDRACVRLNHPDYALCPVCGTRRGL